MVATVLPQSPEPHQQVASLPATPETGEAKPSEQDYFLSQNPTEIERLSYQHEVIKDYMGGKLVLAPVDFSQSGLHIFDSATADGLWLRDLQSSLPEQDNNLNTYTGIDIVPSYFPTPQPQSTTLVVHNMTTPYPASWTGHFDLVHQRLALPGCGNYPLRSAVASLVTLLKPGGWIQLLEADHSGPGSEGLATKDAFKLIKELFRKSGIDYEYAQLMKGWLLEMGLEEVEERVLDVPLGKSNAKKEMGEMGARSFGSATAGLVAFAKCEF
ncbi:MAG: hypothetical protein ASARMPRED_008221 [Alectoria sarmentosa]|nr:MAG: hypothetical protein ASARMPRED_008221 [Alectoria sarmentosa]